MTPRIYVVERLGNDERVLLADGRFGLDEELPGLALFTCAVEAAHAAYQAEGRRRDAEWEFRWAKAEARP